MVNRIGCEKETSEVLDRRLKSLSNFQAMLLRHALSFPSVQRVVYSTCSVYERENELVVDDVLRSMSSDFRLVDILPMFTSRGKSCVLPQAESCVRMSPETSLTIGFFVACLERIDKVPEHIPSSSKLESGGQEENGLTVSKLTAPEMQIEKSAADERGKSGKRRKLKKQKAVRLERFEEDATLVTGESNAEIGRQSEKTLSDKLSSTTGTADTETTRDNRKSHKRKKSRTEKPSKLAKLERSGTDDTGDLQRLDYNDESPYLLSTVGAMQAEQVAACDSTQSRKSHKRKKLKKEKAGRVEQCSYHASVAEERAQSQRHKQSHRSSGENTSFVTESSNGAVQTEHSTTGKSRKANKHKKSKKEKAAGFIELEHSAVDATTAVNRLKHKKSRKHRKPCDE